MFFIDGGYLHTIVRNVLNENAVRDPQKFAEVIDNLIYHTIIWDRKKFAPYSEHEIVRIYYYDAIFPPDDEEFKEQKEYFGELHEYVSEKYPFEMKFGRLIRAGKDGKMLRQKGVDVLLSIDMVVKAFLNHCDVAILVAGDDDFL